MKKRIIKTYNKFNESHIDDIEKEEINDSGINVGDIVEAKRKINGVYNFQSGKCLSIDIPTKMVELDINDYAWFWYKKTNQLGSENEIISVNGKPYINK
tara:strand:- start:20855 stop:21151 length:297 start_codon:yes stop_codon:yes gene_type:complete